MLEEASLNGICDLAHKLKRNSSLRLIKYNKKYEMVETSTPLIGEQYHNERTKSI